MAGENRCSDITYGKNKKNFELLLSEEFIARVTQHNPEKGFQMVRYTRGMSRSMGQRRKEGMQRPGDKPPEKEDSVDFTILDVSDYDPPPVCVQRTGRHVPSKTWRELIKKVWEVDPLTCPRCGSVTCPPSRAQARRAGMKIISLIRDPDVIRQILKHLGLWKQDAGSRCKKPKPVYGPVVPACRQTAMRNLMTSVCVRLPVASATQTGTRTGRRLAPIRRIGINPPLNPVQLIFTGSYWPCARKIYVN